MICTEIMCPHNLFFILQLLFIKNNDGEFYYSPSFILALLMKLKLRFNK